MSAPRDNVSVSSVVIVFVVVVAVVYHVHWHFKAEFCLHAAPVCESRALFVCSRVPLSHTSCVCGWQLPSLLRLRRDAACYCFICMYKVCVFPFCATNTAVLLRLRGAPDKSSSTLEESAQAQENVRAGERARDREQRTQQQAAAGGRQQTDKTNRFLAIYFCPC